MEIKQVTLSNLRYVKELDSLKKAAQVYLENGVNCVPVVNGLMEIIGILSITRILEVLIQGGSIDSPAKEIMEQDYYIVDSNTIFEEIEDIPVERIVVLNSDKKIEGIVKRNELIKQSLNLFKDTKTNLEVILESVHNVIVAIDTKGIITHYNSFAEKIIGILKEDALYKALKNILPNCGLINVMETKQVELNKRISINGYEGIANLTPIYNKGKIKGAVLVFQDISNLELLQQQLSIAKSLNDELDSVISISCDGILVLNLDGHILRMNQSGEKILMTLKKMSGCKNPDELTSWSGTILKKICDQVIKEKKHLSFTEKIAPGHEILLTANPDLSKDGQVRKVIVNIRDLSELNKLRDEIIRNKTEYDRSAEELKELRARQMEFKDIIANSTIMQKILELVMRVAEVECTVLLTGESGVGKGVIAQKLHQKSDRKEGPFIQVNCGAIPENLLESELFGYEKGAFTGANREGKIGLFELANNGTILLDEIGDLPLSLQVKLLKVIQDKEIYRVGGVSSIKLNIRILAATNKDLKSMVNNNQFRDDLFYRLNVIRIDVPSLKDRITDIVPLALYFLDRFNKKYNSDKIFSHEVFPILEEYDWPGNIRELENLVERALIISPGNLVEPQSFDSIAHYCSNTNEMELVIKKVVPMKQAMEILEKELIDCALKKYKSSRKVANALGVSHTTVLRKVKQYSL